jgi:hypothetical protein
MTYNKATYMKDGKPSQMYFVLNLLEWMKLCVTWYIMLWCHHTCLTIDSSVPTQLK